MTLALNLPLCRAPPTPHPHPTPCEETSEWRAARSAARHKDPIHASSNFPPDILWARSSGSARSQCDCTLNTPNPDEAAPPGVWAESSAVSRPVGGAVRGHVVRISEGSLHNNGRVFGFPLNLRGVDTRSETRLSLTTGASELKNYFSR